MNFGIRTSEDGTYSAITSGAQDIVRFGAHGLFDCIPATSYASDAAAAAAGIPVGGLYHTAGAIKVRLV